MISSSIYWSIREEKFYSHAPALCFTEHEDFSNACAKMKALETRSASWRLKERVYINAVCPPECKCKEVRETKNLGSVESILSHPIRDGK
ncbi:hypothetical protein SUGI_1083040 [Cryptomeria japonica]|nr:hypothetical protein SUGI_1083040 [Cryptomeria japonica]